MTAITQNTFVSAIRAQYKRAADYVADHPVDSMLGFTATCVAVTSPLGLMAAGAYCGYMGFKHLGPRFLSPAIAAVAGGFALLGTPVVISTEIFEAADEVHQQTLNDAVQQISRGKNEATVMLPYKRLSFLKWGFDAVNTNLTAKLVGERITDPAGSYFKVRFNQDGEEFTNAYHLPARPVPTGFEKATELAPIGN